MGFRRVLSLLLSAMMLLTPVLSCAQEMTFPAGELTTTTLSDSYFGGYQVNAVLDFNMDTSALSGAGEQMKAAGVLLDKAQLALSFYDDFGTARIRGELTLDGAKIVSGDMLIFEDGSVQMVSSLTGNMAFTLPAGTVTQDGIRLPGQQIEWTEETFNDLPLSDRLRISSQSMISTVINLLLGWVSGTQMETGELYTFDYDTYIDATDTRDAVATRMIGKIRSTDLMEFIWNIVTHIRDKEHDFQAALAMSIGRLGLTRYNGRQMIDSLFPNEEVDPEIYFIQPSAEIENDGALFMYDDLRYLLCKVDINLMNAWNTNTTDSESSMIVSYDDYGEMVGFDAELARFNLSYPYEGSLTYSIKTDEDWQRMHTAHGELQATDSGRVIGDLLVKRGQDVGGVNESGLDGQITFLNQETNEALSLDVDSALNFTLAPEGDGERIEGGVEIALVQAQEKTSLLDVNVAADSALTELGLALTGTADVSVAALPQMGMDIAIECVEYDDAPFEGGQAVDLSQELTQEQLDAVKSAVMGEAAALAIRLALKPVVLGNLLKLAEGLGE